MALVTSDMLPLGTAAPPFDLPVANPEADGREGARRALDDFADADALLVVFTCNHCPYAQAIEDRLIRLAEDAAFRGVAVVAINPNDPDRYPDDSFGAMAERARTKGFPFPYLMDETQDVARDYNAACTPDL
ncbi:MAG: redoxin domain-containing protein, partial [Rubricoccaceae bacterium]|nr:redoxin domain-containing protein [Rubricoccaceae bacterium]